MITEVAEMARHQPKDARRESHDRARDAGEPGARSGKESQSRERSVPGTASAREGRQVPGGTAQDEALEGVRALGETSEKDREKERTRNDAHGKRTQP
ncbi:hypothetical protein IPZ58_11385 [Streptomyces roseoverticillatus]|uniref:hypothetical protein n=1 Tax=Streptomyces roseoverticillatus TaxID=66429 RepID=UPI001F2527DD|nr:hypothetical protein [Streptomyces roseoverticillatus]MCF3102188.1 hypothetical protein [Streptomyces roseoverticillatus]